MPAYRVDSQQSRIVVRARSSIHDTSTTWDQISGHIEVDPATVESDGAAASFRVTMTSFDAGSWLKNRKLEKDFDLSAHPEASFELKQLRDTRQAPDGGLEAIASGVLRWRGREIAIAISGRCSLADRQLRATGAFELDIRQLGLQPPRFLMFKVENEVTVEITLVAGV